LFYGNYRECLVRYDNETGKGDHRHIGEREESYHFKCVETLISDFQSDVERIRRTKNGKKKY
jgi:hypothetical protein